MVWFSLTSLLFVCSISEVWSDEVPVLLWTSDRSSVSFPPAYAGHRLTGDAFVRDYLDVILDSDPLNNVAIFVDKRLSVEDLRDESASENEDEDSNGYHFSSLQTIMDEAHGVVLPAVTSAVDELYATLVSQWLGSVYHLRGPPYTLPPPTQSPDSEARPSLFIVHLSKSHEHLNDSRSLADDAVSLVVGQLEKLEQPFIGLYTSKHASKGRLDDMGHRLAFSNRAGQRHLLDTQVTDGQSFLFVNISNCLYFYTENITFTYYENSWVLPYDVTVDDSSYCANYSASLTLGFKPDSSTLQQLNMTMDFTQTLGLNAGFWYMSNFSISYQISNVSANKSETIDIFPYFVTETPFGLSYSCSYLPQIPPRNITNIGRGINITFEQLQIQAFNISNDQFGYYNDCVGFFNITIWCVLIVLFVLFIILADGVCMMMSLETCDRTEDAKGKTITIMASD